MIKDVDKQPVEETDKIKSGRVPSTRASTLVEWALSPSSYAEVFIHLCSPNPIKLDTTEASQEDISLISYIPNFSLLSRGWEVELKILGF